MMKIKLLLLALLFTAIPKSMWAYTDHQIVTFDDGQTYYKVLVPSGSNAALMFLGTKKSGKLVIPDRINDNAGITFTVTKVGYQAGYDCKNITSVELPETIVEMENDCFRDAILTEMYIPKSLITISEWAWSAIRGVPKCKVAVGHTAFEADDNGVLYTKGKVELRCVPSKIMDVIGGDTYTINENVKKFVSMLFVTFPNLRRLCFPILWKKYKRSILLLLLIPNWKNSRCLLVATGNLKSKMAYFSITKRIRWFAIQVKNLLRPTKFQMT